jgi:thioredoxin 1
MRRRWISLLALLGILTGTATFASLNTVPPQYASPAKSAVLLDFYAKWCGWCQKMAPVVKGIQKQAGTQRLTVAHLDVDSPANRLLVNQYAVRSVPTYYVYNASHQLSFVMNGFVDDVVLKTAVKQATGQLPTHPTALLTLDGKKPLHWVVVQPDARDRAFMQQVTESLAKTTQVHPLALTADSKSWLLKAQIPAQAGAAALMDNQSRILYRAKPGTAEQTLKHYLGAFSAGQPG